MERRAPVVAACGDQLFSPCLVLHSPATRKSSINEHPRRASSGHGQVPSMCEYVERGVRIEMPKGTLLEQVLTQNKWIRNWGKDIGVARILERGSLAPPYPLTTSMNTKMIGVIVVIVGGKLPFGETWKKIENYHMVDRFQWHELLPHPQSMTLVRQPIHFSNYEENSRPAMPEWMMMGGLKTNYPL